jgi:hypothetical protein
MLYLVLWLDAPAKISGLQRREQSQFAVKMLNSLKLVTDFFTFSQWTPNLKPKGTVKWGKSEHFISFHLKLKILADFFLMFS